MVLWPAAVFLRAATSREREKSRLFFVLHGKWKRGDTLPVDEMDLRHSLVVADETSWNFIRSLSGESDRVAIWPPVFLPVIYWPRTASLLQSFVKGTWHFEYFDAVQGWFARATNQKIIADLIPIDLPKMTFAIVCSQESFSDFKGKNPTRMAIFAGQSHNCAQSNCLRHGFLMPY